MNSWILYQALSGNDPLVKFLIILSTDLITDHSTDDDTSEDDEMTLNSTQENQNPGKHTKLEAINVLANMTIGQTNHVEKRSTM